MCSPWLTRRQHLIKGEDLDLIDYEEDIAGTSWHDDSDVEQDLTSACKVRHLDATGTIKTIPAKEQPFTAPGAKQPVIWAAGPTDEVSPLLLRQETDINRLMWEWPEEDSPQFTGCVGENAEKMLHTMC